MLLLQIFPHPYGKNRCHRDRRRAKDLSDGALEISKKLTGVLALPPSIQNLKIKRYKLDMHSQGNNTLAVVLSGLLEVTGLRNLLETMFTS